MHRGTFNEDLGVWDVSQVLNMSQMFRGAFNFNQSIASWEISKVSNMTNMFTDVSSLSDQNKGLIHSSFSTNSSWPYNWSSFVGGGDSSTGSGNEDNKTDSHDPGSGDHNTTDPADDPEDPGYGDHNTTDPYDPNKDDHNTSDPYDPGSGDHNTTDPADDPKDPGYGDHNTTDPYDPNKDDHNTTDPGTDSNHSNPLSIPVFELKVTELVGLTGLPDIKAGGAFALTELFDEYDPQKKFLQLEEAHFDQQVKEWHVQYEGRVFPLKSGFSDFYLLEKYLTDNQLHPVGHIYFDEQKDPYPGAGSDDHNKTDPD